MICSETSGNRWRRFRCPLARLLGGALGARDVQAELAEARLGGARVALEGHEALLGLVGLRLGRRETCGAHGRGWAQGSGSVC